MHYIIKFKLSLFVALLSFATVVRGQITAVDDVANKLWEAIGGKENWLNARYFMFSCIGGDNQSAIQGERKYLWDKQTGNCRFEGLTTDDENLIVLFNIKTTSGTVYLNGTKLDNPRTTADIVKEIAIEFEKDAYLLFLPTALEGDNATYTVAEEKLVGAQRFTVVNIKNRKTSFEGAVDGQLYVDSQTGQAQRWRPSQVSNYFVISGFKDIGGGLVLPTRFIGNDTTTSITYPLAAALVNIEGQKFSRP
ncbi:hypothetical protein [Parapedobacter koreensis]|uniref:Uncharacterized protein n=1 Tax=Parapedobacter koreensis TaxID=332977 RepID=A0A1H7FEE2_9SPHI|nr:hypothetical protein [Parapedobacter koreensis]SEK22450.1 hypothetical protein SAMN05421740_101268 [Parapedobacter koreensis]